LKFGTCGPAGWQVTTPAFFLTYQQEYFMSTATDVDWKSATSLAGKVVVMTGVSSGIGRATALQFVSAGAAVVGGDLNVKDGEALVAEIRASGGKADFLPLDLSDGASVDSFVAAARGFDPDIVVNVAGWDKIGPFIDNTPDLWDKLVRINFLGPIRMIHGLLPGLMAKRYGKVITVSSDAGRVGSLGETFYAGTKGGIIAFTKSLAREMSRYNINCNVICPGPTDTPLFHSIESEKLRAALVSASPMRRLGKPVEVANGIVFLASPAADFVQGQVLSVSGGLTMHG
jgi:2-hydroxycyclohexanecarboxyl-CoA dehydrogenase